MTSVTVGKVDRFGGAPTVQRAFVFVLDPTPAQTRQLLSHCGAARVAYNEMLAQVKANLGQREAERSYSIADEHLTEPLGWSAYTLRKQWNLSKEQVAPWWAQNSKLAYEHGCFALAAALKNFASSKNGTRKGAKSGFPAFKSKRKSALSVSFAGLATLTPTGQSVKLPRIGIIHSHESTRTLGRLLESGRAKVNSATVSYKRGRWQAAFQVETINNYVRPAPAKRVPQVVGIDIGVKDLIVVATPCGVEVERITAPQQLAKARAELRRLQRQAARQVGPYDPSSKTRRTPSAGWTRTQERIRSLHAGVANLRQNHLHHVTTRLAKTHQIIGIETLNTAGMLRKAKPKPDPARPGQYLRNGRAAKRGLSRAIADASFGELAHQLDYKTSWYGAHLVRADRFYPSSKTCSGCGAVKAKLHLSEREYNCTTCGLVIDRDLNAAINIARLAGAALPDEGSSFVSDGGQHNNDMRTPVPASVGAREVATPPAPRGLPGRKARRVRTLADTNLI